MIGAGELRRFDLNWQNRKLLVTGAGGFIGSHLTERLLMEGAQVRAFVRYNSRGDIGLLKFLSNDIFSRLEIISGDLRDVEAVRNAVKGVDAIFHLGALIAIPYSYVHPREVIETNIMGTVNILSAAREYKVNRIVHTSTSEVYGTAQYTPIDEIHPLQGQSPYSASKIGADKIVESFYRSFSLPVATIRPFNTFGPRQSARAVIPTIITQVLTCNELRLGSIEPMRDFTFVTDTVEGFLQVGNNDAAIGQEINIGAGTCISIGELAKLIMSLIGRELPIITDEQRIRPTKSEVLRLHASNKKALELLGWEPRFSLSDGLKQTIDWIEGHLEIYHPHKYEV